MFAVASITAMLKIRPLPTAASTHGAALTAATASQPPCMTSRCTMPMFSQISTRLHPRQPEMPRRKFKIPFHCRCPPQFPRDPADRRRWSLPGSTTFRGLRCLRPEQPPAQYKGLLHLCRCRLFQPPGSIVTILHTQIRLDLAGQTASSLAVIFMLHHPFLSRRSAPRPPALPPGCALRPTWQATPVDDIDILPAGHG